MKYVDELLPDLMFQAPDVSDAALSKALRLGAQDYFRESEVWQVSLPEIHLFSGVNRYRLRLPAGTRIARVDWVKQDGEDLEPIDLEDVAADSVAGYHITNDEPHSLLVTDRTKRGPVTVGVRLYPTPAADEIPDGLFYDVRTPLVSAAIMRIYGAPGSPWFDPQIAALLGANVADSVVRGKRLSQNRKQGNRRTVRYGGY